MLQVLEQCKDWCPDAVRVRMTTEQTVEPEQEGGPLMPSWGWDGFTQGRNLQPGMSMSTPLFVSSWSLGDAGCSSKDHVKPRAEQESARRCLL